jgi:hypothetical protein
MSSGFLLAQALSEVLRKPYHKGDVNISVNYLVEGIKIGEYRVMLKRDFDTACWVPPVGKRASHSIYYGDRMVARVLERFVRLNEIKMPEAKEFVAEIKTKVAEEKAARKLAAEEAEAEAASAAAVPGKKKKRVKLPLVNPMHPATRVLDAQLKWLRDNCPEETWELFLEWLQKAVISYGRHERGHARNTPQDMKQVNRDLRTLGIPFTYWNLFEDARMEHVERNVFGPFDWMMFEDLAPADGPYNMFLRCIQFEGVADVGALESEEPYAKDPTRTIGHIAESVESYYKRALACTTAEHLYPVITEFLEEFKDDLPPPEPPSGEEGAEGGSGGGGGSSSSGKGKKGGSKGKPGSGEDEEDDDDYNGAGERAGDLSTAAEAADKGDEFFEDFDKDADIVGGTDAEGKAAEEGAKEKLKGDGKAPPPKGNGGAGLGTAGSIAPTASGGAASERYFLTNTAGEMDEAYRIRVEHLTGVLMRMFKAHTLPTAVESPGQRMSGRHLARGELRWLKKRVFGGKGKRKYSIVFDCSGSMSMFGGRPQREGKLLLLALNELARRGYLEGTLVLSGWVGHSPGWLTYEFPVKDEIILRIHPHHSSEGLQAALKDNLARIKGMDDVFVMTDANICDSPIDRDFFAKHRIWPVGLYVGPQEVAGELMAQHFPQNIIRDTIEQVVEAMLTRNRRTVG